MTHRTQNAKRVAVELESLKTLSHAQLKERWNELYDVTCPAHMSRRFLLKAIAYRIQEKSFGGLSKTTRRRLDKAAAELAAGRSLSTSRPKIKPGTRLLREWQGTVHEVIILDKGVRYRDQPWPSLSAVAREITGARWSGPRFFGLTGEARGRA